MTDNTNPALDRDRVRAPHYWITDAADYLAVILTDPPEEGRYQIIALPRTPCTH